MNGVRMRWKMLPERRRGTIGRYVDVSAHLSSAPAFVLLLAQGKALRLVFARRGCLCSYSKSSVACDNKRHEPKQRKSA